jgi:predicted Abi (CAAX) family protease
MRMDSTALVRAINETVVGQAVQYVYGADNYALRFVERLLAPDDISAAGQPDL